MFDDVHKKCGSRTTNDPRDPTNLAARRQFMAGVVECITPPVPVPSSSDIAFYMGYMLCEQNRVDTVLLGVWTTPIFIRSWYELNCM